MREIPMKINEEIKKNSKNIWSEKHDRLQNHSEFPVLDNENQYKLWKTNCAIRKAFSEIEKDIIAKREKGLILSVRDVGWSEIARRARCDRNTLKHPIRLSWVEEHRQKLLNTIKKPIEENSLRIVKTPEEGMKFELDKTKSDLKKSENETSKWFLKYHDTIDDLKVTKATLTRQMKVNSEKDELIIKLKKQLKELMKQ